MFFLWRNLYQWKYFICTYVPAFTPRITWQGDTFVLLGGNFSRLVIVFLIYRVVNSQPILQQNEITALFVDATFHSSRNFSRDLSQRGRLHRFDIRCPKILLCGTRYFCSSWRHVWRLRRSVYIKVSFKSDSIIITGIYIYIYIYI